MKTFKKYFGYFLGACLFWGLMALIVYVLTLKQ